MARHIYDPHTDFGEAFDKPRPRAVSLSNRSRAGRAPVACIGEVTAEPHLVWRRNAQTVAALDLPVLLRAWKPEENE